MIYTVKENVDIVQISNVYLLRIILGVFIDALVLSGAALLKTSSTDLPLDTVFRIIGLIHTRVPIYHAVI